MLAFNFILIVVCVLLLQASTTDGVMAKNKHFTVRRHKMFESNEKRHSVETSLIGYNARALDRILQLRAGADAGNLLTAIIF